MGFLYNWLCVFFSFLLPLHLCGCHPLDFSWRKVIVYQTGQAGFCCNNKHPSNLSSHTNLFTAYYIFLEGQLKALVHSVLKAEPRSEEQWEREYNELCSLLNFLLKFHGQSKFPGPTCSQMGRRKSNLTTAPKEEKKRKSWRRPEKKWHITYKGIMISIRGDFQSETTRSWRKCSDSFKVLKEKRIVNSEFYTSWKYHSKWSFLVQHGRSLEVITPDQTTRGKWTDHQQLFLDPSENGGQKKRNGICMSSSRD